MQARQRPSPFSKSGIAQRDAAKSIDELEASLRCVQGRLEDLKDIFPEVQLLRIVEEGKTLVESSGDATAQAEIGLLVDAYKERNKEMEKVPDPAVKEKAFLSYMSRFGTQLHSLSKTCDKRAAIFEKAAECSSKDISDFDEAGVMEEAKKASKEVLNLIAINALVTLLRNPQVRMAGSTQSLLAEVYQQFSASSEQGEGMCLHPEYHAEAQEILARAEESSSGKKTRTNIVVFRLRRQQHFRFVGCQHAWGVRWVVRCCFFAG